MQNHADGVGLLASLELFALIDVEQGHRLQQLLLAGLDHATDVVVGHLTVHEQRQVAAQRQRLGQVGVLDVLLHRQLAGEVPVNLCIIDRLVHVKLLGYRLVNDTHHGDGLAAMVAVAQGGIEDFVLILLDDQVMEVDAHIDQHVLEVGLEVIDSEFPHLVGPRLVVVVAAEPHRHLGALAVGGECFFLLTDAAVVAIDVAELVETQVGVLVVDVAGDALQTAEQQCLTHDVQVAAEGIHNLDAQVGGIGRQALVVGTHGQRVVHHLVVTDAGELVADGLLHVVAPVHVGLVRQAAVNGIGKLDVVVAIDAQDVLDHVTGATHVNAVGGHDEVDFLVVLSGNFHFQALDDVANLIVRDVLADEALHIVVVQLDGEAGEVVGFHINDVATDFAACQLLDEHSAELEVIDDLVGVDAALEAERSVGVQAEAACRLANPCGMEVGRLQEHVGSGLGHTRVQTAEHTTDAHRLLAVANHQVAVGQRAFHTVEGGELGARLYGPDHDAVALDLAQVKAVHGLSCAQQDVVGDVDDVVDGTLSHSEEQVLEPLGALLHLDATHGQAGIAGAGLGVLNGDGDAAVLTVDGKLLDAGLVQIAVHAVTVHPCCQVACHTVV